MSLTRVILTNDRGHAIGQDHHRAKLTDQEVALVLLLRTRDKMRYKDLARIFEVSKTSIVYYCTGKRRGQVTMGQKVRATV